MPLERQKNLPQDFNYIYYVKRFSCERNKKSTFPWRTRIIQKCIVLNKSKMWDVCKQTGIQTDKLTDRFLLEPVVSFNHSEIWFYF